MNDHGMGTVFDPYAVTDVLNRKNGIFFSMNVHDFGIMFLPKVSCYILFPMAMESDSFLPKLFGSLEWRTKFHKLVCNTR